MSTGTRIATAAATALLGAGPGLAGETPVGMLLGIIIGAGVGWWLGVAFEKADAEAQQKKREEKETQSKKAALRARGLEATTAVDRLKVLEELRAGGLISADEYEAKRKAILDGL